MKTMCPPGYHHNNFMATRVLGHMMYGLYIRCIYTVYIYICVCVCVCIVFGILIILQSFFSAFTERLIRLRGNLLFYFKGKEMVRIFVMYQA